MIAYWYRTSRLLINISLSTCARIIWLSLSASRYLLTVYYSCPSHCDSFHFLASWLGKLALICPYSIALVSAHSLFHRGIKVFLNLYFERSILTISACYPPSSPTLAFFLITFKTLFFSASLSLLKRFYFQVKSKILLSRLCLARHFSNKSVRYL